MELKAVKELVKECLTENESARDSDWKLYECVCQKLGFNTIETSLHQIVMASRNFPSFESVSRARRKFQAVGLFLPSENVDRRRYEKQEDYIKTFARG